jgi:hypothetical protein
MAACCAGSDTESDAEEPLERACVGDEAAAPVGHRAEQDWQLYSSVLKADGYESVHEEDAEVGKTELGWALAAFLGLR